MITIVLCFALFLLFRLGEDRDLLSPQAEKVTKPPPLPRPHSQFPKADDESKEDKNKKASLCCWPAQQRYGLLKQTKSTELGVKHTSI